MLRRLDLAKLTFVCSFAIACTNSEIITRPLTNDMPNIQPENNLANFSFNDTTELNLTEMLSMYRFSRQNGDYSRMQKLLTLDFELDYYKPRARRWYAVIRQDRSTYLKSQPMNISNDARSNDVVLNIRGFFVHSEADRAMIVATTIYESKYFMQRFIESYLFINTNNGWRLRRLSMIPTAPLPEETDVQVFVTKPQWEGTHSLLTYFPDFVAEKGPDFLIDLYRVGKRQNKNPPNSQKTTVLFVFREAPQIGSRIRVERQYWGPTWDNPTTFQSLNIKTDPNPFFVIEIGTGPTLPGDKVLLKIFVDDVQVAEKSITTP